MILHVSRENVKTIWCNQHDMICSSVHILLNFSNCHYFSTYQIKRFRLLIKQNYLVLKFETLSRNKRSWKLLVLLLIIRVFSSYCSAKTTICTHTINNLLGCGCLQQKPSDGECRHCSSQLIEQVAERQQQPNLACVRPRMISNPEAN